MAAVGGAAATASAGDLCSSAGDLCSSDGAAAAGLCSSTIIPNTSITGGTTAVTATRPTASTFGNDTTALKVCLRNERIYAEISYPSNKEDKQWHCPWQ